MIEKNLSFYRMYLKFLNSSIKYTWKICLWVRYYLTMYSILLKNRLAETILRIQKHYGTFFFRTHKIFFSLFYRQIGASFPKKPWAKKSIQSIATRWLLLDPVYTSTEHLLTCLFAAVCTNYALIKIKLLWLHTICIRYQ